jgi:hypothetical protein
VFFQPTSFSALGSFQSSFFSRKPLPRTKAIPRLSLSLAGTISFMKSTDHILSGLPDCDDVLRRLANALQMPATCRKRACRRDE